MHQPTPWTDEDDYLLFGSDSDSSDSDHDNNNDHCDDSDSEKSVNSDSLGSETEEEYPPYRPLSPSKTSVPSVRICKRKIVDLTTSSPSQSPSTKRMRETETELLSPVPFDVVPECQLQSVVPIRKAFPGLKYVDELERLILFGF